MDGECLSIAGHWLLTVVEVEELERIVRRIVRVEVGSLELWEEGIVRYVLEMCRRIRVVWMGYWVRRERRTSAISRYEGWRCGT